MSSQNTWGIKVQALSDRNVDEWLQAFRPQLWAIYHTRFLHFLGPIQWTYQFARQVYDQWVQWELTHQTPPEGHRDEYTS
jgi:hypothetical protein